MNSIWIATTEFRFEPRWDDEGMPNLKTFIDGAATTDDLAKAFALMCSEIPVRWFKGQHRWLGGHRTGDGEFHFHLATPTKVADHQDHQGWPRP